jgi:Cytochrome c
VNDRDGSLSQTTCPTSVESCCVSDRSNTPLLGWFAITFAALLCLPRPSHSQSVVASIQDPLAGSRVFGSEGCSKCHSVNGVGGKVGPDLGRVQANCSYNDLAVAMWNHLSAMAVRMKERGQPLPQLDAALEKGLGSPAAVIAALRSHGDLMVEPAPEQSLSWPQLKSDELVHLMAFFERSTRSER